MDGGCCAVWSPDGSEIFFRRLEQNALYAVAVDTAAGFRAGNPRRLFEWEAWGFGYATAYDVSPDGSRLLAALPADADNDPYRLVVVENWFEELKRLVPTD